MEQHPVPQHIASYEFRLVGDMTLKQFGLLAGPCIIALISYASSLPDYFKWPLIIFFVFLGIAMAFLPIEERPLHRWLIAFFKAVYSPTQFIWKKQPKKPAIFEVGPAKVVPEKQVLPPDQASIRAVGSTSQLGQLTQYLKTLPVEKSPFEQQEETFLKKVTNLFQVTRIPVTTDYAEPQTMPVRGAKIAEKKLPLAEKVIPPEPVPPPPVKPQPKAGPPLAEKPPLVKKPFKIKIEPEKRELAVEAKISPELPFPQTPQTPNILVGMVLDQKGKIIEGAILEIRSSEGIPVRALKTNKIGQFRVATPLKNDTYEIETEKKGYHFDIIKIKLSGEIVEPIEIRAK